MEGENTSVTLNEQKIEGSSTMQASIGQTRLDALIRDIGSKFGREAEEIDRILEIFKSNWLTEVTHWTALSESCKKSLPIPLSLKLELDRICLNYEQQKNVTTVEDAPQADVPVVCNGYCYVATVEHAVRLELMGRTLKLQEGDSVQKLFEQLGAEGTLYIDQTERRKVHPLTKLKYALIPGRRLVIRNASGTVRHYVKEVGPFKAVESWLRSLGLDDVTTISYIFDEFGIDDFLVLPFMNPTVLDDMGITRSVDKRKIMRGVKALQDATEYEFVGMWIRFMGFASYEMCFVDNMVDISIIPYLKYEDLHDIGFTDKNDIETFFTAIKYYREYSSAEATFAWLHSQDLGQYAYQFARYNIPFYCLPLVNFFIIDEMGVTSDDQVLLNALQNLRSSPCYIVKGMCYWLRDLELEHYSLVFARNLMVDFVESLTILNDHTINRLMDYPATREKMKAAVREMKEVQFYYSASASLLQELVLEKYSKLFAKHRISIDVLPLLNESNLVEMGFTDAKDRESILGAVKSIKEELPAALRLFSSSEPNLYRIDQKDPVPRRKWDKSTQSISTYQGAPKLLNQIDELYDFIARKDMACKKRMSSNKQGQESPVSRSLLGVLVKGNSGATTDVGTVRGAKKAGGSGSGVAQASALLPPASSSSASAAASASSKASSAKAQKKARQRLRKKQRGKAKPQDEAQEADVPGNDNASSTKACTEDVAGCKEKEGKEGSVNSVPVQEEQEQQEVEVKGVQKVKQEDETPKAKAPSQRLQKKEHLPPVSPTLPVLKKGTAQQQERNKNNRKAKQQQQQQPDDDDAVAVVAATSAATVDEPSEGKKKSRLPSSEPVLVEVATSAKTNTKKSNSNQAANKNNKTPPQVTNKSGGGSEKQPVKVVAEVDVNKKRSNNNHNNTPKKGEHYEKEAQKEDPRVGSNNNSNNKRQNSATKVNAAKHHQLEEKQLSSMLDEEIMRLFEREEEEEEDPWDGLDPDTKALLDKEVEEFSKRLESINNNSQKAKEPMPPCLKDLGLLFANARKTASTSTPTSPPTTPTTTSKPGARGATPTKVVNNNSKSNGTSRYNGHNHPNATTHQHNNRKGKVMA